MRISRVYIDAELVGGQVIALDKAQSHYLKKVLRLKHGAAFFCLMAGQRSISRPGCWSMASGSQPKSARRRS